MRGTDSESIARYEPLSVAISCGDPRAELALMYSLRWFADFTAKSRTVGFRERKLYLSLRDREPPNARSAHRPHSSPSRLLTRFQLCNCVTAQPQSVFVSVEKFSSTHRWRTAFSVTIFIYTSNHPLTLKAVPFENPAIASLGFYRRRIDACTISLDKAAANCVRSTVTVRN